MANTQINPDQVQEFAALQKKLIRRRFLESVALVLLALTIIALPLSLMRIFSTGMHFNHIIHLILGVVILSGFFLRKKLSDIWLIVSILGIFIVLSISSFLQYSVVSAGFYFAGAAIFVAGLCLGVWGGVICAVFFMATTIIIAHMWVAGYLVFPVDVRQYILLPSVWGTLAISFIITTAVFFVSATGFLSDFNKLVDTIEKQKQKIEEKTKDLSMANKDLKEAMTQVKTLHGLLPICARCKKIRNDKGYWQQVEDYVARRTHAEFTHSLCPECVRELYPDLADRVLREKEKD